MSETLSAPAIHTAELIPLSTLKPHPRNYRGHPADQLEHLAESLRTHGQYRNVVVARDGTILAGHGVALAASRVGWREVSAIRLDLDPHEPRALKVLAGDNEIAHLGEVDDRALTELLKEVLHQDEDGLLGTGYDEAMLANLLFVTRPKSEIADFDAAAEWLGMPDYQSGEETIKIVLNFRSMEDRAEALRRLELDVTEKCRSSWFPAKEIDDRVSLKWTDGEDA